MQTYQCGLKKRNRTDSDQIMKFVLLAIASVAVLIVFLIIVFILGNSWGAIEEVGILHFLFGNDWNISKETFGALNIILGSILVTIGAIAFALPIGLGAAIYISEIASPKMRNILKPVCEVFAGIPSVVYGFFGVLVLLPFKGGIVTDGKTLHLSPRPRPEALPLIAEQLRDLCARPLVESSEQLLDYTRDIPDTENRVSPRFQKTVDQAFSQGLLA